jgi:Fe-S-cluster containining protein
MSRSASSERRKGLGKMVEPKCCMDMDIDPLDLIFPERLSPEGKEFIEAHGIFEIPLRDLLSDAENLGNGMLKIRHRCDMLNDDGLCRIYETRPKICRDFDCSTRTDCACKGKGKICQNCP